MSSTALDGGAHPVLSEGGIQVIPSAEELELHTLLQRLLPHLHDPRSRTLHAAFANQRSTNSGWQMMLQAAALPA